MSHFDFGHFRHHNRFYLALLIGILVTVIPVGGGAGFHVALGGITFYVFFLVSSAWIARSLTVDDLRRKASFEDEGIAVIAIVTLATIALSLTSLARLLANTDGNSWLLLVAIANVPLGWATLHTVMAFHYAHLYYSASDDAENEKDKKGDARGLEFPKTEQPSILDFIYYSFVVGMTAQVSDVEASSQTMRRTTVIHGVTSFFFNTVILAFTVNVVTRG